LSLLAEAFQSPAMHKDEWALLQEEMLDEQQSIVDDDESLADHFLRRQVYAGHPLARSLLGEPEETASFTLQDVREMYDNCFHTAPKIWGFAGDVTSAQALEGAHQVGLNIQNIQRLEPLPYVFTNGAFHNICLVNKPDRTQIQWRVGQTVFSGQDPRSVALSLGVMAFGGTFTSPFTQEIRDVRGWSYFASAEFNRYALHPSAVVLKAAPALNDAVPCVDLAHALFHQWKIRGVAASDLALARSYSLHKHPFSVATAKDVLSMGLTYFLLGFKPETLYDEAMHLQALAWDEQWLLLQTLLQQTPMHTVMVGPAEVLYDQMKQKFPQASINTIDFRSGLILNP
jgi:predicted Zn-dependent peptidase